MASILTLFRHTPVVARTLTAFGMLCIAALPLFAVNDSRDGSREPDIVGRMGSEAIVGRDAPSLLDTPDLSYLEYGLNDAIVLNHEVRRDNGVAGDSRIAQSNGARDRTSESGTGVGSGNAAESGEARGSGNETESGNAAESGDDGLQATVDVETSGGAPLLLTVRVAIDDSGNSDSGNNDSGNNDSGNSDTNRSAAEDGAGNTGGTVSQVFVRTDSGSFALDAPDREEFEFQVSPFGEAGVYDLEVLLLDGDRRVLAEERFEVGFADFRYGRNDFSFASDAESLHGRAMPYSPVLRDWLAERFDMDEPGPIIETLLLAETYDIFKWTVGRGYAFSGSKERYFRFPDELPSWYEQVYDIRESDPPHQARMNRLQNDIIFTHFVFGDRDPDAGQTGRDLAAQVEEIRERIARGDPVTISYLTPARHHAMLVYGYIRREGSEIIDLIASNNRARDNASNLENEDAETVRVDLESGGASWVDAPAAAYEHAGQLFVADVRAQADDYDFSEADLERFVDRRIDKLREESRAVLVVEMAAGAALVNADGRRVGRLQNRNYMEFDGVQVQRAGDAVRFAFDPEMDLELRLEGLEARVGDRAAGVSGGDMNDARVYSFTPVDSEGDSRAAVARSLQLSPDEQRVFKVKAGLVEFED